MELFKYLSEDRIKFLKNGMIRFTQPQAFNDPFELKPSIIAFGTGSYFEEVLDKKFTALIEEQYNELPPEIRKVITKDAFIIYAESKKESVIEGMQNLAVNAVPMLEKVIHEGFEKHVGVLSLTETSNNLLMWAHYANSHEGMVVGFNSEHPFFDQRKSKTDELRHLKKIKYSKLRPRHVLEKIENTSEFLVKSTEWEYEQEWRMLVALADADVQIKDDPYDVFLFKVPFDAITSLYVGARASTETKNNISSLLQNNSELKHIDCFNMEISGERFELKKSKEI